MQIGETHELTLENMSFGPAAVGRIKTKDSDKSFVVFVEGGLPEELVRVKLTKIHKSYAEGELLEVLKPSVNRISPPCPVFGQCGGCQWQHLDYPAQVNAKKDILLHQLNRSAHLVVDELLPKLSVYAATNPFGYRSRLQVHGNENGIGFFAKHSHNIVPIEKCLVTHPDIQKTWQDFLKNRSLKELSSATGQFKIEWLRKENGEILEALNRKHSALGFTQINSEQNEVLKNIVKKLAHKKNGILLELYGGDGNLTDDLVSEFNAIISVDSSPHPAQKTQDPTKVTAKFNGTLPKGRTFIQQNVDSFLVDQRWMEWGVLRFDVVIADPPRSGLENATRLLARLKTPKLILVSCDPTTLARDLSELLKLYSIESIHLVDMFPQTFHMETIVELVLK